MTTKITCLSIDCPERKSLCCGAISEASIADEGTGCFVCSKCKKEYIGGECNAGEKLKKLNKMTSRELVYLEKWAEKEIKEYQKFLRIITKEQMKRFDNCDER